jgi:hypothetical protein
MLKLSVFSSKMSFFLLAFFAVPLLVETSYILKLWLKNVPEYAVIFCQLILVISLFYQITIGTMAAVTSVGNIKRFQISVGLIEIFTLPLAWVLMKLGLSAYFVFVGALVLEIISGIVRIWFAHVVAGLNLKEYYIHTWLYSLASLALTWLIGMLVRSLIEEGIVRALIVGVTTSLSLILLARYVVFTKGEFEKSKQVLLYFIPYFRKKVPLKFPNGSEL